MLPASLAEARSCSARAMAGSASPCLRVDAAVAVAAWQTFSSPALVADPEAHALAEVVLPAAGPPEDSGVALTVASLASLDAMFPCTFAAAARYLGLGPTEVAVHQAGTLREGRVMVFCDDRAAPPRGDADVEARSRGIAIRCGELLSCHFAGTCLLVLAPPCPARETGEMFGHGSRLGLLGMGDLLPSSELRRALADGRLELVWTVCDVPARQRRNWLKVDPASGTLVARRTGHACFACGARATKKCGRCRGVAYCSSACQALDWPRHKVEGCSKH